MHCLGEYSGIKVFLVMVPLMREIYCDGLSWIVKPFKLDAAYNILENDHG